MGQNLVQRILSEHLVEGSLTPGEEIGIRIDQTLTQDATGTMAYLQFEAMGLPRVKTKLSVSYVDHNMLQTGFENADDHRYLQGVAAKYGIHFSRPGNGICHQVHLERFAAPGATQLGSDSHTPTAGGIGALAIGAGGLDVACAMAGQPFFLNTPKVVGIKLSGQLQPWVAAKDVILEVLRRLTVKGGVGKIMEYCGEGVGTLSVPERATITNMGAELGATTSVFPSDAATQAFLKAQGREDAYRELGPDADATYDEVVEINLSELEPLLACPSSPDAVKTVTELAGTPVAQVCVGSCTNSSFLDLMLVANALAGKSVHPGVSLTLSPGSKQVFTMIGRNGALADLIAAGVRVLESGCGPCIGQGQSPPSGAVSLRTFNRNFPGRSGTEGDKVYLCSPEVAVAAALTGVVTDPRTLGDKPPVEMPERFSIDDNMVLAPAADPASVEIVRGPNIAPLPLAEVLPDQLSGPVLLKLEDNITTDHIMPAGTWLKYRSNVPAYSQAVFYGVDSTFPQRAKDASGGFVVGGGNYGQGSSREHAALVPMYLGLKAVLAKSFARIHKANLVNFRILPLTFEDPADYDTIDQGDQLELTGLTTALAPDQPLAVRNVTKDLTYQVTHGLTDRQLDVIRKGGLLNAIKQGQGD
ncbi:MAG: aconitate hydratase [Armatimonadetes bacterium CG_4_10_14_3_um_filter_66_18]|nr:aconitate hydratase [Armatimonadota bacterium]OIP08676.1 MAG: aconitate hydratase [Armatimonadetes bacterium CG2_30_66_41]PIU92379.1 MAG: aconitate hydratase [Armatimonadetes bacterium CG06_land_8_20_14_3_00_66_21]PIX38301.1 MAG: aconitate hydratase [Armatimonadetes bacterium CG_4_8_14_3_um_filter_66_20]PIY50887.1 MAG: aconitate hydratase [Armatimonadetes bacterium CG_4_10_14_3_um_filter_66_18]PIZ47123.1 MAG: aconitate hydratase [Armatimonadetes bacterium CG_4_10_14_0_8_um_filter_66_14]PJB